MRFTSKNALSSACYVAPFHAAKPKPPVVAPEISDVISETSCNPDDGAPAWLHTEESHPPEGEEAIKIEPSMPFREAAQRWVASQQIGPGMSRSKAFYIKPETVKNYQQHAGALTLFFGTWPLDKIRIEHLRRYQQARVNGDAPFIRRRRPHEKPGPCPTRPAHVNQELRLLIRILKRAALWKGDLQEYHRELSQEQLKIVRALTVAEEEHWLQTCMRSEDWKVVCHYSIVCLGTCMGTNEIRSLKLADINFESGIVTVPIEGAKNKYRHRTLPILPGRTLDSLHWLVERAKEIGSGRPEHYLFPLRHGRNWDVTKPMTVAGLKKEWDEIRRASGLVRFRRYDLRHTAVTRFVEAGKSLQVVMQMAGHVSPHMTQHYTQISMQAKANAMRDTQEFRQEALLEARQTGVVPSLLRPSGSQLSKSSGQIPWGLHWTSGTTVRLA